MVVAPQEAERSVRFLVGGTMVAVGDSLAQLQWGIDIRDAVVNGEPVVLISGDVHSFNAHRLAAVMMSYSRHEQLILDLSGVRRFASAGLDVLVACQRHLSASGCSLVLRNPSKTVSAVLEATGTRSRFVIREVAPDQASFEPAARKTDGAVEVADHASVLRQAATADGPPAGNWLG